MILVVVRILLRVALRHFIREVIHSLRADKELLVQIILLEDAVRAEGQRIVDSRRLEDVAENKYVESDLLKVLQRRLEQVLLIVDEVRELQEFPVSLGLAQAHVILLVEYGRFTLQRLCAASCRHLLGRSASS